MRSVIIVWVVIGCWTPSVAWACPACAGVGGGAYVGATGLMLNSWTSGRRIFRVQMHAPGICVEGEHEGKGYLYADGDTDGQTFDTQEVAGGSELYEHAGFLHKNREFIDCLKSGKQPESNFSDAVKTMEVAETILAVSLLEGR